MAAKITDAERQHIVELIHSGKGCREIADEVGRSVDSISRIGQAIGWTFGQTNLVRAHEARSAYSAERRAAAAAKAQERLEEILDHFESPRPYLAIGRKGPEVVMIGPDARAVRDLAQAVNLLQRTVLDIDRHDNSNRGDVAARGLLERVMEGLQAVAA